MTEDLKVYKKINKSDFKTKFEHIYYNLDKKVAEITICEEKKEDVVILDEERFVTDKTIIKAITPNVIPIILVKEINEINWLVFFKFIYLSAIQNS